MQKTTMIDSITGSQDLQMNNSTSCENFDLFIGEIQKMYSNKDWRLNVIMKSYYDCALGNYNANETV